MTGKADSGWRALSAAEVGESHLVLTPPLPCQDACATTAADRPLVIVADGLGSRPLSHIGADAVVRLVPCHLAGIEAFLVRLLDCPLEADQAEQWCQAAARGIVRFAGAVLDDLGRQMGHDGRAFQCTLLLAFTGSQQTFWLQVGDGDLVFESRGGDLTAALPGREEAGSDADVTHTVLTARQLPCLPCGLIDSGSLRLQRRHRRADGLPNGREIARVLRRFFQALREGQIGRTEVLDFLRDRATWHKTSRDDRSLALLARIP